MEEQAKCGETEEKDLAPVHEKTVTFKYLSDRSVYHVISERNEEVMVEISGYDLNIAFNMQYINCLDDIEAACNGLSELFKGIILEKLLEGKQNTP